MPWDTASWEPGPAPDKDVKINHSVGGGSGYTATNPTGMLSRNTFQMSGPTKYICFEPTVWPDTYCS